MAITHGDIIALASALGGGGGSVDYDKAINKPKINGVELSGDKTGADLGLTKNSYESIKPVGDSNDTYLFEATYLNLDYEKAKAYFDTNLPAFGACSFVSKSGVIGRNYDWLYDNQAEFIVRTSAISGRYASVCVAGQMETLTKDFVQSGDYSEEYDYLPFKLMDGKNEKGLFVSIHTVPNDKGNTTGTSVTETNPDKIVTLNALMLIRYLLDNCNSVDNAIATIQDHVSIYVPKGLRDLNNEVHFILKDDLKTVVLEFVNNECVFKDITNKPVVTNFFIDGVTFKSDGTIYEIEETGIDTCGLTNHAQGLERYNVLVNNLTSATSIEDLMQAVKYTKLYTNDIADGWLSEYCGTNDLAITNLKADFETTYQAGVSAYSTRTRDGASTFQTCHTALYDENGITIYTQENYSEPFFVPYKFIVPEGLIIDVGNNQYVYEDYVLPAIDVSYLKKIFANHIAGILQVIKWTLLGSESYFGVVSADIIAGEYSIDILVHNKYHCQYTWSTSTTGVINPVVVADKMDTFIFKGYITNTAPTTNLHFGELWYNSSSEDMPTTFPIQVKKWDGTAWSTETEDYTPSNLEMWANRNNDKGYYWFGNEWNLIDSNVTPDDSTLTLNGLGQMEMKDQGHDAKKIKDSAIGTGLVKSTDGSQIKHKNNITQGTISHTITSNTFKYPNAVFDSEGHISSKGTDGTLTFVNGVVMSTAGAIGHSNSITAGTFNAIAVTNTSGTTVAGGTIVSRRHTYDAQGHITSANTNDVTITLGRGLGMYSNVIGHSNNITANTSNALKSFAVDANGHITAYTAKSLGRGISDSSNTIGHSNSSITAGTAGIGSSTAVITGLKWDAYGHLTAAPSTATIYPPTTAGSSGQFWKSDGSGQGVWGSSCTVTQGTYTTLTFHSAVTAGSGTCMYQRFSFDTHDEYEIYFRIASGTVLRSGTTAGEMKICDLPFSLGAGTIVNGMHCLSPMYKSGSSPSTKPCANLYIGGGTSTAASLYIDYVAASGKYIFSGESIGFHLVRKK